jgi:hypothetical protein
MNKWQTARNTEAATVAVNNARIGRQRRCMDQPTTFTIVMTAGNATIARRILGVICHADQSGVSIITANNAAATTAGTSNKYLKLKRRPLKARTIKVPGM